MQYINSVEQSGKIGAREIANGLKNNTTVSTLLIGKNLIKNG